MFLDAFRLHADTDECLDAPGDLQIDPLDAELQRGSDDSSYLRKSSPVSGVPTRTADVLIRSIRRGHAAHFSCCLRLFGRTAAIHCA